jgi:hypothetical protein
MPATERKEVNRADDHQTETRAERPSLGRPEGTRLRTRRPPRGSPPARQYTRGIKSVVYDGGIGRNDCREEPSHTTGDVSKALR